ncbi:hypothetical protein M0812_09933 [Anaeramoeba flamelloides]|uniref:Uncharacterized protein n=1 Tax=Anaeramoeba flamelloides TaxID=1746091 RepID=A0AAV7ZPZ1_9EUKA|nr:hypothetical protein M0812_09933 [Anaeramoeba flamelloides]
MKHAQQDRMLEQMYRNTIFSLHNTNPQEQKDGNYYEALVDPIEEIDIGVNTEMDHFDPIDDDNKCDPDYPTTRNREFIDPEQLPNMRNLPQLSNIPNSSIQRKRVLEIDNSSEVNVGLIGNHILSLYYHWSKICLRNNINIFLNNQKYYSKSVIKYFINLQKKLFHRSCLSKKPNTEFYMKPSNWIKRLLSTEYFTDKLSHVDSGILSKETNELWNGEHWCYSTIFSKRWLSVDNNLFKLGSIFQENDDFYVIISFFQNEKLEHTAILQQYTINKQIKFQQNQTLYELSPISPPIRKFLKLKKIFKNLKFIGTLEKKILLTGSTKKMVFCFSKNKTKYDQFDLQFQKLIDETETVEDGKNHIILPLIIYSDDFKFNSSLETQKSTVLNGIYLTFASQKRKTRKLENSHFPITFIPGTKNLYENLSPIINDLKKLEKGIKIKMSSNEEAMVFAPIIIWITDFEEKAKLLGIKKAGGKTKNSCIECTQTRDDWIMNNEDNILLKDNLYYKKISRTTKKNK